MHEFHLTDKRLWKEANLNSPEIVSGILSSFSVWIDQTPSDLTEECAFLLWFLCRLLLKDQSKITSDSVDKVKKIHSVCIERMVVPFMMMTS